MSAGDADVVEDGERSDVDRMVAWARSGTAAPVDEGALPVAAHAAIEALRARHPGQAITVLAFRTLSDGVETARMGPASDLPPDDRLVAVSVVTAEATAEHVSVVAHVVVAQLPD